MRTFCVCREAPIQIALEQDVVGSPLRGVAGAPQTTQALGLLLGFPLRRLLQRRSTTARKL